MSYTRAMNRLPNPLYDVEAVPRIASLARAISDLICRTTLVPVLIDATTEAAIRAALASGKGVLKTAREFPRPTNRFPAHGRWERRWRVRARRQRKATPPPSERLAEALSWQEFETSFRSSIRLCRRFLIWVKAGLTPIGHCPPNSRGRVHAMRATALQAPPWLVVIDKGSYETLTYFLNRTMAELWRRKHGGQLYERELEPPYWRAAKPEAPGSGGRCER